MKKFVCPPIFIAIMGQFDDGMQARVQNDREYAERFPGSKRVVLRYHYCSAWCFLSFSRMLFRIVMLVFLLGTALMASSEPKKVASQISGANRCTR